MTPENRFSVNDEYYGQAAAETIAARVIPKPLKTILGTGTVDVSDGLTVDAAALPADMQGAIKSILTKQGVATVWWGGCRAS